MVLPHTTSSQLPKHCFAYTPCMPPHPHVPMHPPEQYARLCCVRVFHIYIYPLLNTHICNTPFHLCNSIAPHPQLVPMHPHLQANLYPHSAFPLQLLLSFSQAVCVASTLESNHFTAICSLIHISVNNKTAIVV